MPPSLTGKVAVVTGAANGIGEATARCFAEQGAKVVLSDMVDGVTAAAERIADDFPQSAAAGFRTDVSQAAECEALIAEAVRLHSRLDILVVAGAVLQKKGPLARLDPEEWDRVMGVNARGPFLLSRSAVPVLPRPGGRIILLASFSGEVGVAEYGAYCASKGAVRLLVQSLALELASDGITVNAVAPAYVESELGDQAIAEAATASGKSIAEVRAARDADIPLKRQATASEVADAMLYLAEAAYVTGSCLDINGGVVLR